MAAILAGKELIVLDGGVCGVLVNIALDRPG